VESSLCYTNNIAIPQDTMPSLTAHFLHLDEEGLKSATQHPFLEAAATASLPQDQLKEWLGQDRLYQMVWLQKVLYNATITDNAKAYLNFMGEMLRKIPVPSHDQREASLEWRAVDIIIDSLTNIRTEIKMFEETAEEEGWLGDICGVLPTPQTRAYQDLFAGATAQGRPLVVGLTVLWATEECYLRAWKHANLKMDHGLKPKDKDVMQRVFIPNWSSPEFEAFVRRIGGVVNKFGQTYEEDSWEWQECEIAFKQVLWAEEQFWPKVSATSKE
jgi:thiaminase